MWKEFTHSGQDGHIYGHFKASGLVINYEQQSFMTCIKWNVKRLQSAFKRLNILFCLYDYLFSGSNHGVSYSLSI